MTTHDVGFELVCAGNILIQILISVIPEAACSGPSPSRLRDTKTPSQSVQVRSDSVSTYSVTSTARGLATVGAAARGPLPLSGGAGTLRRFHRPGSGWRARRKPGESLRAGGGRAVETREADPEPPAAQLASGRPVPTRPPPAGSGAGRRARAGSRLGTLGLPQPPPSLGPNWRFVRLLPREPPRKARYARCCCCCCGGGGGAGQLPRFRLRRPSSCRPHRPCHAEPRAHGRPPSRVAQRGVRARGTGSEAVRRAGSPPSTPPASGGGGEGARCREPIGFVINQLPRQQRTCNPRVPILQPGDLAGTRVASPPFQ